MSFSSARGGVKMAGATSRISRVLVTGPLAPFAEDYRRELRGRGYTERSAVNQLRQVARFSRWLQAGQLSVPELSAGRVEEFPGWQRAVGRHRSQWSRPGLVCLLDVLRELGVLAAGEPVRAASPAEVLLAGFGRYLAAERGLAAGTVRGYVSHARRFLEGLPAAAGLAGVCAKDVTEAVLRESAAVSVSATQFFVAGLRSFLRFCFIEGQVPVDLSQAALPVTGRRRSPLPRGIAKADARALLAEVGPHRLRHTVACEMVAAGVPLAEIAQVLRHHSLQTTALYGRVDLDRLRALAAPWPGGVQ